MQPPAYTPSTDFSDEERDNVGGRSTVRTAALDAELSAIATTLTATLANLSLNQRDDGEIRDGRVKLFTLAGEVLALLTSYGATPRGPWLTATAYAYKDLVSQSGNTYIAVSAHTAGTFATDLAAGKWLLFSLGAAPGATQVTFTPTATVSATNVQAAIQEVDAEYRAADTAIGILIANLTTALAQLIADLANTSDATKGAALIGRGAQVVDSISALRGLLKTSPSSRAFVTGYYAAGDGGGGPYYLDAADTTSTDNGGTIIVASDGGRWKLILEGTVSVKQFGARGNYTGGAMVAGQNDTAAIQAAINWAAANIDSVTYGSYSPSVGTGAIYFPQGSYGVNAALTIPNKVCIFGEGQSEYTFGSRLTQTAANTDLFQVTPGAGSTSFSVEKMILRTNTVVGTGHLVNMVRTGGGQVNSQRYVDCTFAQPQAMSLYLAGDDIVIKNCLFDVSTVSGDCIQFGTATALASNVRVEMCDFFNITDTVVKLVNIDGLSWGDGNVISQPNSATKTMYIFDAITTAPTLAANISISGGLFKGPRILFGGDGVDNLTISGATIVSGGIGGGEVNHMIELAGNCSVNINGNLFRGSYDTANFYNDAGATAVFGTLAGNTFINDGGAGDALSCANFTGRLGSNYYSNFTNRQMGERRATTGAPVNPGLIAAGATFGYALTVVDATPGDQVAVGTISNAWIAQTGIVVEAFVQAADTVRVEYRNVTGGGITPAAHDIWAEVTR